LLSIPLWEPEPDQHPLPFGTCYFTQHSTLKAELHGLCHFNISVTSQIFPPSGLSFWCNGTLHACANTTIPGPCLLVVIILQLTLYGGAELAWLLSPQQRRAAFLPVMVGIPLVSSIAASGLAGGALGHSLISASDFKNRLQVTLELTSVSLASLQ
jgi:hypothetical protein